MRPSAPSRARPSRRPQAAAGRARAAAVRRAEACRAAPALRFPARARRGAQVLGGAQGSVARSRRQAHGGRGGGSPFDYASFEGVIPAKQYGAGKVIVWDCGVYSPDEGAAVLFRRPRARRSSACAPSWPPASSASFCAARSSRARSRWCAPRQATSGCSSSTATASRSRTMCWPAAPLRPLGRLPGGAQRAAAPRRLQAAQLAPSGPAEALPDTLAPMLAETGEAARSDPQWRYEPKLDGYRVHRLRRRGRRCGCSRGAAST